MKTFRDKCDDLCSGKEYAEYKVRETLIKDLESVRDLICNFLSKHLETKRFFKVKVDLLYAKASISKEIYALFKEGKDDK